MTKEKEEEIASLKLMVDDLKMMGDAMRDVHEKMRHPATIEAMQTQLDEFTAQYRQIKAALIVLMEEE